MRRTGLAGSRHAAVLSGLRREASSRVGDHDHSHASERVLTARRAVLSLCVGTKQVGEGSAADDGVAWRQPRRGRHGARPARPGVVLAMLTFVYVLNFLDRQLLGILAKPIQDSLHITDGQLGLIGGLYFAMFYCFIAIPVSWLADRTNRVAVLTLACAIWSAATIACGLARTYPQLVVARMTVGLRRGGRRAAVLCADHRHLRARAARDGVRHLQPRARRSARRWASRWARRSRRAFDWRDAFVAIGVVGIVAADRAAVRRARAGRAARPIRQAHGDAGQGARSGARCARSSPTRC